jgi:hypothetical protein
MSVRVALDQRPVTANARAVFEQDRAGGFSARSWRIHARALLRHFDW